MKTINLPDDFKVLRPILYKKNIVFVISTGKKIGIFNPIIEKFITPISEIRVRQIGSNEFQNNRFESLDLEIPIWRVHENTEQIKLGVSEEGLIFITKYDLDDGHSKLIYQAETGQAKILSYSKFKYHNYHFDNNVENYHYDVIKNVFVAIALWGPINFLTVDPKIIAKIVSFNKTASELYKQVAVLQPEISPEFKVFSLDFDPRYATVDPSEPLVYVSGQRQITVIDLEV